MDEVRLIEVKENILADNQDLAAKLRAQLRSSRTYLLNLMSSPGSGKTSLIMRTIEHLQGRYRIGVIEADIDSTVDAEKVAAMGVKAVQLRTGGFCHLDATMVASGLGAFDLSAFDLIIIENVGTPGQ
jgi:hydrogenase nickel incorporation protein HypB